MVDWKQPDYIRRAPRFRIFTEIEVDSATQADSALENHPKPPFSPACFFQGSGCMRLDSKTIEHIEAALREIAILFIALAPLDVFLGESRNHAVRNGLIFVGMGVIMFVVTLITERQRLRG
jgi:hypothetical protein